MRFNILYGNHGDAPAHLEDLFRYIRCGLIEAGHYAEFNSVVIFNACNILLEGFKDADADVIVAAEKQGYQFITIVSELVTGNTFNNINGEATAATSTKSEWYSNRDVWQSRFDAYLKVAHASRAIWCVAELQLEGYRRLSNPDRVHVIPFEFVNGYSTIEHQPEEAKNIDFLFTGTLSKRRTDVLTKLREAGALVVAAATQTPEFIRNNLISRARICLNLMQTDDWTHYSTMRFYYHVMNKSFIVSERASVPRGLNVYSHINDYVDIIDKEVFVSNCLRLLRESQYTKKAEARYEAFRDAKPASQVFQNLLEKTLALQ